MCIHYHAEPKKTLALNFGLEPPEEQDWPDGIWEDYSAPIIVDRGEGPQILVGTYGLIPKKRRPQGMRFTTMNARSEGVATTKSYKTPWARGQLCLVPMRAFYEPCWETGHAEQWRIGMADESAFAVAGLFRAWQEEDESVSFSFTQLTINANEHYLMKRMHRVEDDDKRSLVIVPKSDYERWLTCRNPEVARTYLKLYPAELMAGQSEGRYGSKGSTVPSTGNPQNDLDF